jgi:NAD(P)-dependent dehydrogenase (short-subunit alcohol dehydrogenase family)
MIKQLKIPPAAPLEDLVMQEQIAGRRVLVTGAATGIRGQAGADRGADEAVAIMGGLDVLIHAAGSWGPGIPGELSEDNLDAMFSTNVKATVYANQAAFRHMTGADRFRAFLGPEAAAAMTRQTAQRLAVASSLGPSQLGDPVRDLGPVLVFLASAGSRFITGQLLSVSGGLLMLGS